MKYFYRGSELIWPHMLELYIRDVNFFHYNWHPEFEFTLLLRGRLNLAIDGDVHTLCRGDVFLINPNHGHAWMSTEKDSTALSIHFAPQFISDLDSSLKIIGIDCVSTPLTRNEPRFVKLRQFAAQMMLSAVSNHTASRFVLRGAFSMLLGTLLADFSVCPEKASITPQNRRNLKSIQNVIDWLEKNYQEKITLEAVARVAGYNRSYFSAFFRRNVGISFYDYLRRIRFRHALYQLNNSNRSLTEIAVDCGFPDLKTFSAYYKKTVHELPAAARRSTDVREFTHVEESERIFLDTSSTEIGEALHAYADLQQPVPSLGPDETQLSDYLAQLDGLGRQMQILSQKIHNASRL